LKFSLDRPEGRTNLANFYSALGNTDTAENYFKSAIVLGPALVQAYVNLADLYRSQQRDEEAEQILQLGLQKAENKAPLHHALGLNLVRQGNLPEALVELKKAVDLAPNEARYDYVYGVALQSSQGYPAAIKYLEQAHKRHPADLSILFTLASFSYENEDINPARMYAEKLLVLAPQHQGAQQLLLVISNQ